MSSRREPLRWKSRPFPELIRLAWPIGVSTLSYSVMTLVDTLFVGRLGASALAGVSLGGVAFFTMLCFGFGLLRSVKVLVSQAVGAGQGARTPAYVGAGLFMAAGLGAGSVIASFAAAPLLGYVSASAEAAALAAEYLQIRGLGAPLALVAIALREARYGSGDSAAPMRATLLANVANIALDYWLIIGLDLGVAGAAWATVAATGLDALWLAAVQRRDGYCLDARGWSQLRAVWRLGVPLGVQMLLEVSAFALLTFLCASMSEIDVAAHQIALQVAHLSFLPAFALGEAASVLAGQAVGAGHNRMVLVVARQTLWAAVLYTGACGAVFALFPRLIAGAFTGEAALVEATVSLFYVAAVFQIFDGANIVARSVLRGAGDVRYPAYVSVAIAWLTTPPVTLALGFGLGLGALGGWIGLCIEITLGALVLWRRLERGRWARSARRARADLDAQVAVPAPAE